MNHGGGVEDIRKSFAVTHCLDGFGHLLMHGCEELLLFLLNVLFCGLVEELDTLLHLLELLLTDLFDCIRHRRLLRLIVLILLLNLLVHRSQLVLVLGVDCIHLETHLFHLGHLCEEFLTVDVTEFLCAGKHRQSQQHCDNKFFHCYSCFVVYAVEIVNW